MEVNKVYHMDNRQGLPQLPEKCGNLIISDPPYFEVKGDFDFVWKSFDEYLEFMEGQAKLYKRILSDNGTLFVWGNSKRIAYIQTVFDKYFYLENSMMWRKPDSMQYQYYSIELSRCFNTHNERLLMYSNEWDISGLKEIYGDENCFSSIKQYLRQQKKESGLTNKDFNHLFSKYFNKQGCLDRSVIEHYWGINQWVMPTKEIYDNILQPTGYFQRSYDDLREEYEKLKKEYEDIVKEHEEKRRPFNNTLKLEEVLEFSQESHVSKKFDHDTIKPEKLTRALILTCSRPNDLVVVPFAGSGTECAMSAKEGRRFIGFETTERHVSMSNNRVRDIMAKPTLFG